MIMALRVLITGGVVAAMAWWGFQWFGWWSIPVSVIFFATVYKQGFLSDT